MSGAGPMNERVRFSKRKLDVHGRKTDDFELQFEVWAEVFYREGGEVALQARLEQKQPVEITIYDSRQAREIAVDWRAEHTRFETLFNIVAAAPAKTRGKIRILAQADSAQPS